MKVKDILRHENNQSKFIFLEIWRNSKANYSKLRIDEAIALYGDCQVITKVHNRGEIESLSIRASDDRFIVGLI